VIFVLTVKGFGMYSSYFACFN